ncbi:MAG TPA: metallophosphoesterase, partial [Planctomycetota bacterium]|nr:metallophosphoesterase [Planctomycetota bacterium]
MKRFILGVAVAAVIIFGAIALWTQRTGRPPHHEGTPATGEAPRFKFVVIADLTGGRPSDDTVFDEVISEINLVDPDFTLCVGDLIEGYSDSPQQVQAEWEVFNAEVGRLNRPFYYVFGNHDATTPVMIDILRDRFKNLYYAFDHKQCHFIVLFSETRSEDGALVGLSGDREQIAWLRRDLATSTDAVHTFVFLHRPGLSDEITRLFADRPTTIFAGHDHIYRQETRDGINFITLGSSGARMHGDLYSGGLFHYMLVTVSGEKVIPAIVRVGAILPADFLSVERQEKIAAARAALWNVTLALGDGGRPVDRTLEVRIPNPLPSDV